MMESQRGQTLPLTLGGIIAIIVFGFFAVNFANTLRWQVRAQNAADSAAQALLALQTQQFNQMTATLYAGAVEEYRIRHLLNGMVLSSHGQGGCASSKSQTDKGPNGCNFVELLLEAQFQSAVARYTGDVLTLHQVTARMNFTNISADAQILLGKISKCDNVLSDNSFGGDCAFSYGKPIIQQRLDTEAVYMDANAVIKPSPGNQTALASSVSSLNAPALNAQLFAPMQVEVYACATVPSIIPSFLNFQFPPFTAVARGAATPVMVEEDWLQPGTILNPTTPGKPYQVPEQYLPAPVTDATGYDWYDLDFGGNGFVAVNGKGFSFQLTRDEFSVYVGWWNSIPIHAFGGQKPLSAMGCAT